MKEKLEPCPFCGGEEIEMERVKSIRDEDTDGFYPTIFYCKGQSCYFTHTLPHCTEVQALAAWNKRTTDN